MHRFDKHYPGYLGSRQSIALHLRIVGNLEQAARANGVKPRHATTAFTSESFTR